MRILLTLLLAACVAAPLTAQAARRRWEMQRLIRLDKFGQVLPSVMRARTTWQPLQGTFELFVDQHV